MLSFSCWGGWANVPYSLEAMRSSSFAIFVFIIILGNELCKVVIKKNASPSIKGGRVGITIEVTGDNLVLTVAQDAL